MTQDHPIQRFASLGIALLGVAVALFAVPGLWIGLAGRESWGTGPIPLFAGFEALTLLSGITAIIVGLRPPKQGFGLAVLCIAGAVFVAAVLGVIKALAAVDPEQTTGGGEAAWRRGRGE